MGTAARTATVGRSMLGVVFGLPRPVRRLLAGPPVRVGGVQLDLDTQLFRRLSGLAGSSRGRAPSLQRDRCTTRRVARLLRPSGLAGVPVRSVRIPTGPGVLPARLYDPPRARGLLVFFHSGGFVQGCLDSADPQCRFLARHAGTRVLSVGYRLAPEHPYPAGRDDAVAALRFALDHRGVLGPEPGESVAVGGASAGANLALEAALTIARAGETGPVFVWALYPVADIGRTGGSRETLGTGFGLTAAGIARFERLYLPLGHTGRAGPALVRVPDLAGMPPVYLASAGFDPLRDEGEELACRLRAAGVPVTGRRFPELEHGFAGLVAVSGAARSAVLEAAAALRAATAPATGPPGGPR